MRILRNNISLFVFFRPAHTFAAVFRGGCNKSEIIPLEPDRDNACEGIRRKA